MVVRYKGLDDIITNASKMNASRRTIPFAIGWIRCESNIAAAVNHELTTLRHSSGWRGRMWVIMLARVIEQMRPSIMSGKVIVALLCWVTRPVDTTEEVINPFSRPKLVGIQSDTEGTKRHQ
ncbi:hypothetical protein PSTG_07736 [Puccinia striiformis f. sp. tritici PST-78]|uniref:Uncharacterized protein n=1 Tax=Puccinia striiformis f. sp. tritici PST-78 TaxID=1165861 RepID=A0A0L0VIH4_9BASI|nr:hypothetical protein PSTG_07736 [Puccinia striiformis f. sp. tritici PST-78]